MTPVPPLAGLAALAAVNALLLRRLTDYAGAPLPDPPPRVSVLVPARDEEANLGRLLPSLLAQDYPALEIVVLDDNSSDGTLAVARAFRDPRLRVLEGAPLPPGWLGKPHACHQLALAATGDILVFTDADTVWAPGAAGLLARAMLSADALSAWPRQELGGPLSKLLQPVQQWSVLAFLPLALVPNPRFPLAVAANGQLLAFSRALYDRVGGHAAARASVIEDMALARAAKRAGGRFALLAGGNAVACRMYATDAEVWGGFAKNVYPGLGASPLALGGVLALFAWLYLWPWVGLATGRGSRSGHALAALLGLAGRAMSDASFGYWGRLWPAHPLAVLAWSGLALDSARRHRRGVAWKGRRLRPEEPTG